MESLQDFIGKFEGVPQPRIERELGYGYVLLKSSEVQRRQASQDIRSSEDVLLEILRNAIDASAHHIFIATGKERDTRTFVVIDDGIGIPKELHRRIFEARVTSKLESAHPDRWGFHGRGMALYSIRERTQSARVIASEPKRGTVIEVQSDTTALAEKTDQSTFPALQKQDGDTISLRGPKNLVRTASEFALEYHDRCVFYFGSVAEIASTLYNVGLTETTARERAYRVHFETQPFWLLPSNASDGAELAQLCQILGLEISERTARRILDREIEPVQPLHTLLAQTLTGTKPSRDKPAKRTRTRRLVVGDGDKAEIFEDLKEAVDAWLERYYASIADEPEVRLSEEALTLVFPVSFE